MAQQPLSSPSLAAYTILAVSLPPLPAFSNPATHYLYLRKDAPRVPTPDTPRSVFVANVPIDACERSVRALFKQVGTGAMVERVHFEDDSRQRVAQEMLVKGALVEGGQDALRAAGGKVDGVTKKRKRKTQQEEGKEMEDLLQLPETWEARVRKSGSSAVVVFVDKASADMVLRECKNLAKKGNAAADIVWRAAGEWGEKRTFLPASLLRFLAV
jgi:ribosomal RNA-processing protein 7